MHHTHLSSGAGTVGLRTKWFRSPSHPPPKLRHDEINLHMRVIISVSVDLHLRIVQPDSEVLPASYSMGTDRA